MSTVQYKLVLSDRDEKRGALSERNPSISWMSGGINELIKEQGGIGEGGVEVSVHS